MAARTPKVKSVSVKALVNSLEGKKPKKITAYQFSNGRTFKERA